MKNSVCPLFKDAIHSVRLKSVLPLVVLLIAFGCCLGQKKDDNAPSLRDLSPDRAGIEWNEGGILLTDGNTLEGLVKYDTRTGILSFEQGRDSRSFTARNVLQFWFHDYSPDRERRFYSIASEELEGGAGKPYFFEILKEFTNFAILSKTNPPSVEVKGNWGGYRPNSPNDPNFPTDPNWAGGRGTRVTASQEETLYIFDAEGNIEPYLRFIDRDTEGTNFLGIVTGRKRKTKAKIEKMMLEHDMLEEHTAPYYPQLKEYARENKLNFKKKDELLQILDYYATLSGG